jgi:TPR repeat protein
MDKIAALTPSMADQGGPPTQHNLGVFHEQEQGRLEKDERDAARLYQVAADMGLADAQCHLGAFHQSGRGGLAKSTREAARLYRLAAEQGHAQAQYNLGVLHQIGLGGLARDEREAARLYRLAAEQGLADSLSKLGRRRGPCAVCGRPGARRRCGRCPEALAPRYCDRECQAAAWPQHQLLFDHGGQAPPS